MKKPFYYEKPNRGRNSREETELIKKLDALFEKNPELKNSSTIAKNVDELNDLFIKLNDEPVAVLKKHAQTDSFVDTVYEEQSDGPDFDLDEPAIEKKQNSGITENTSTDIFDNFDMFESATTSHPFNEQFDEKDLFKLEDPRKQFQAQTEVKEQKIEVKEIIPSAPNAWEMDNTEATEITESSELINEDAVSNSTKAAISTDGLELPAEKSEKVKLEDATKRKATASMAKVASKMISFVTELGGQRIAKFNPKELHRMSKEGLIDLHAKIGDKTISQIVNEHNDVIPEIIKNDPDLVKDLENAIKLVMEGRSIEVTPEQNLAAVAIMMLFQLIQAGMEHKRNIKTLIKQASDNYLLNIEKVQVMAQKSELDSAEIQRLRFENEQLINSNLNAGNIQLNEVDWFEHTSPSEIPVISFKSALKSDTESNIPKKPQIRRMKPVETTKQSKDK